MSEKLQMVIKHSNKKFQKINPRAVCTLFSTTQCSITDTTLTEGSAVKPLSSFDVSPSNILLAAGTELTEGDAYILFWDIRNTALLGAYWESHTDDITQVDFDCNASLKNNLLAIDIAGEIPPK